VCSFLSSHAYSFLPDLVSRPNLNVVLFRYCEQYRVGLPSWKELLDAALEKFVSAGAAAEEIDGALKNHPANLAKEKDKVSSTETHVSESGKVTDSNGINASSGGDPTKEGSKVKSELPEQVEESSEGCRPSSGSKTGNGVKDKVSKIEKGREEKAEDKSQTKKKSQGR
jgi:hypothetical protein